ncbi:MAG: hypothetical protein IPL79_03140 [Myxococcales bacterium]|nr:hypothetical protein [Myxococcales bacterium]
MKLAAHSLWIIAMALARGAHGDAALPAAAPTPAAPTCQVPTFKPPAPTGWRHRRYQFFTRMGSPQHMVHDDIVLIGQPSQLVGKFAYGDAGKDLEDETITLHIGTCSGWRARGSARTDDDGKVYFALAAMPVGTYAVAMSVAGDASYAIGRLRVAPPGARVAVFDIDGTLTVSDRELFKQLAGKARLRRTYDPRPYDGGPALTAAVAARGLEIVYITARPYWMADLSRAWLTKHGFAAGTVRVTSSLRDSMPSEASVGEFKIEQLAALRRAGFAFEAMFGNSTTDISAYASASVPASQVYIIGPNGGVRGTVAVGSSWRAIASRFAWSRRKGP